MNKIYFTFFFFLIFFSYPSSAIKEDDIISHNPLLNFWLNFSSPNSSNYSIIQSYAYLNDPEFYITGDNCGNISFWNFSSGNLSYQYQLPLGNLTASNLSYICSLQNRSISNIVVLENNRKIIFSAGQDLYLYDFLSKNVNLLSFHLTQIVSLTYLRKTNWFVSADAYGRISFWDSMGNFLQSNYVNYRINVVESEYDSNFLLVGGASSYLNVINIESNKIMKTIQTSSFIKNIRDMKYTDYIAVVYIDDRVDIINKHNWKIENTYSYNNINSMNFEFHNNLLSISEDQQIFWTNLTNSSSNQLLNASKKILGNELFAKDTGYSYLMVIFQQNIVVYNFTTHDHAHDKNSTFIVNETLIWNVSSANVTNLLHYHDDKNQKEFLIYSDSRGYIQIANITNGDILKTYNEAYERPITALIQITNTNLIAFGAGKDIIIWDVEINSVYRNLSEHTNNITSLVYIPEIDRLVSGSLDGFIKIWDIECCSKQAIYISIYGVKSLDYIEKTSNLIVISFNDDKIQIWDMNSGKLVKCFDANQNNVSTIINIPKSPFFLTAGSDNSVFIRNKNSFITIKSYQLDSQINGFSYEPNMDINFTK